LYFISDSLALQSLSDPKKKILWIERDLDVIMSPFPHYLHRFLNGIRCAEEDHRHKKILLLALSEEFLYLNTWHVQVSEDKMWQRSRYLIKNLPNSGCPEYLNIFGLKNFYDSLVRFSICSGKKKSQGVLFPASFGQAGILTGRAKQKTSLMLYKEMARS
jgi:hypothetical protein